MFFIFKNVYFNYSLFIVKKIKVCIFKYVYDKTLFNDVVLKDM